MKKIFFAVFFIGVAVVLFLFRFQIKDLAEGILAPDLPEPVAFEELGKKSVQPETKPVDIVQKSVPSVPSVPSAPQSFNLDIPFGSQAPFANWDLPYQETCEEAAVIMAHYYLIGKTLNPKIMDEEILKLIEWENKTFGYYEDTIAEEIARTLREYFGHKNIDVKYEFTVEDIKGEVLQGRPVIVPAAGRLLPNPNFKQPGPLYHALVIKGYTKDKIITNDPGTRKGHDFLYTPEALMNAIHDWNPEDILLGKKAMIVVKK